MRRAIRSQKRGFYQYLEEQGIATRKGILYFFTGRLLGEGDVEPTEEPYGQERSAVADDIVQYQPEYTSRSKNQKKRP